MGTRGLHPTAFGSPVGRGRPQPALPPNPAAASGTAHGGEVCSPWAQGKRFCKGIQKRLRRRRRWQNAGSQMSGGGKSTLTPTPLGPSFRLCSKATSLPLCAGRARTPWGHCCHLLPRGDTRENVLHVQPPPHTVLGDIPGGRGLWHRPGSATGAAGRCQKVGGSIRGPRAKRGGGRAAAGWEQNATEREGAAARLASWSRMMVDGKGAGQHPLSARPPAEVPARVPRCAPRAEPGTPEQQRAMEGMVAARTRPRGVR